MNQRQMIVIWTALVIGLVMGAFPPWEYTTDFTTHGISDHSVRPAGYAFIGTPPEPIPLPILAQANAAARTLGVGVRIDSARIAVQGLTLFVVASSLLLAFGTRRVQRGTCDSDAPDTAAKAPRRANTVSDGMDDPATTHLGAGGALRIQSLPSNRRWCNPLLPCAAVAVVYAAAMTKYGQLPAFGGADSVAVTFIRELGGCIVLSGLLSVVAYLVASRSLRTAAVVFCGVTLLGGYGRVGDRLAAVWSGTYSDSAASGLPVVIPVAPRLPAAPSHEIVALLRRRLDEQMRLAGTDAINYAFITGRFEDELAAGRVPDIDQIIRAVKGSATIPPAPPTNHTPESPTHIR